VVKPNVGSHDRTIQRRTNLMRKEKLDVVVEGEKNPSDAFMMW
jgi:hypothetical protein